MERYQVVVAVALEPYPWRFVRLEQFNITATRSELAEQEACRLALAKGYQVLNALVVA